MKAVAPGKLLLTGAYAVLEGAPAIVVAVDRHAVADAAVKDRAPSAEVRALLGDSAPRVDVTQLLDAAGNKLGLGSSAAALVAALGAIMLERGDDLAHSPVRERTFADARAAHARVQSGGSGFDVAASVFGGVLRYTLERGEPRVRSLRWPPALTLAAFWTGTSARTSELRARVDRLRARDRDAHQACLSALAEAAVRAADAMDGGAAAAFVDAARDTGSALAALGAAADAPIVPAAVAELARLAGGEGGAFLPSGAGGGDVAVFLGIAPPSGAFLERARLRGLTPLALAIDPLGVRASGDRRPAMIYEGARHP